MTASKIISKYKKDIKTIALTSFIKKNKRVSLSGLSGNLTVIVPIAVSQNDNKNHCFVLPDKKKAFLFYSTLCDFLNKEQVFFFPYSFRKPYDNDLINNANVVMRTEAVQAISNIKTKKTYIVTYPEGIFEKFPEPKTQKKLTLLIKKKKKINHQEITKTLSNQGFVVVDFVTSPGQYAIRGNIIDVFSFTYKKPIRIECDNDVVERIKVFNIETQLTEKEVLEVKILSNIQKESGNGGVFMSLFEFLNKKWVFWVDEFGLSANIIDKKYKESAKQYNRIKKSSKVLLHLPPNAIFCDKKHFLNKLKTFSVVLTGQIRNKNNCVFNYNSSPQPKFNKNLSLLVDDIRGLCEKNYSVFVSFQSEEQVNRLNEYFNSIGSFIKYTPLLSRISEGFIDHENKRAFYTDHEIFNRYYKHLYQPKIIKKQKNPIKKIAELNIGDYVVHIDYGVGRFVGLEKIMVNNVEHESLRLVYKNNDTIYTNTSSLHKIAKYTGSSTTPTLSNLSSGEWYNKKKKIKKRLVDIAEDLIKLYVERRKNVGFVFDKDSFLQIELESSFVYQDTPDQTKTTESVKKDMESAYPMDRLVCGDVGFGKTEIAIRAAFKAVCSNKQVLVLVPTTILAFQHYKTFNKRLKNLPVDVDYLSRFRPQKHKTEIIKRVGAGKTNILIGTHSALNKRVVFKDLGLLIVDEEQKFGVALKEKIKKRKTNLDCLTLTATPIPRTLHFSLIGVRDISIIRTPPPNRQPVYTELTQFNKEKIRDIINSEIMRFGQVFFVHNRVEDIYEVGNIIQKLVPAARVTVAHGQQKGGLLEKTILKFIEGYYDVLVSTNIIESGLDIPNANTIIINQAHMFGLSDLHQMRGRVGRSNKKAFCYLMIPKLTNLTLEAKKRLVALEEFSNLGDGLNIALKDLDIRGAGNLLGGEQSGFINDLGFDTYNKILDEALNEIKHPLKNKANESLNKITKNTSCLVDPFEKALIPKEYITNTNERLKTYGFIEKKSTEGKFGQIVFELEDRFGKIPKDLKNLITVMKIKKTGSVLGIDKITIKKVSLVFVFFNTQNTPHEKQKTFVSCLRVLDKENSKYLIKEKKNQISIHISKSFTLNKTLLLLKKIKK